MQIGRDTKWRLDTVDWQFRSLFVLIKLQKRTREKNEPCKIMKGLTNLTLIDSNQLKKQEEKEKKIEIEF